MMAIERAISSPSNRLERKTETEAQRQVRPGQRQGGFSEEDIRRFQSRMEASSSQSMIKDSWAELTFAIKVDDETLIKARFLYQKVVNNNSKAGS